MKKNALILSCLFIMGSLCACSSDEEYLKNNSFNTTPSDIILQERDGKTPEVKNYPLYANSSTITRSIGDNGEIIGNSDALLGYSYSIGNSIIGDYENVKFPVLDLDKIKAMRGNYVVSKQINTTSNYSFSYNGMSRYETNSQVTKTVKTGFSLSVGLFKIGRQKKNTEIFKSSLEYGADAVYGELNLEVRSGQFELLATAEKRKTYARQCLSQTFLSDLYRGTLGNIIESYGPFVLRSYITGGKATAFYSGKAESSKSTQSKETGMTKDINASFTWKSNSASGDLSFGNTNNSSSSSSYETKETEIYIKTFGGDAMSQAATGPHDLSSLSLDLSSWLNSLRDKDTHTIIDITSGSNEEQCGLYPLSDFVLEKNFKCRLDDTTNGFLESFDQVLTPRIEIVKVLARTTDNGEKLYEVATVLNTRQGDKIVLSDGTYKSTSDASLRENNNSQNMMDKVQKIFTQKKAIFQGLQFSTNYSTTYDPNVRKPLCLRLDGFNENSMNLYVDPKTNMRYIYDSQNKIALSYIDDEEYGDYVLDDYGIRSWVESLPEKNISMMILQNYTIIGL